LVNWTFPSLQNNAQIHDFTIIKNLGEGSFGLVKLVEHKSTKDFYAMKVLIKAKVVKTKQVDHTLQEKKILQAINHPFLVNLKYSFKVRNALTPLSLSFVCSDEMII
jgi:protein kinase A